MINCIGSGMFYRISKKRQMKWNSLLTAVLKQEKDTLKALLIPLVPTPLKLAERPMKSSFGEMQ